ncbi:hypothetical protein CTI12_AA190230 [Artemisia annua]|uniref:Uncharacterized protein n=1 Tax=Artemisia annua TaxID=35608 RepID=A0A2U1P5N3_ARTAN|nr:hypothetical protein CTI12_AA354690 [Artemisia annua]PWA81081.1 hypothetical protein CTI12_AA190230 [Artemisia annua]
MESPEVITFSDDFDSACSTPFVSAPSSPGRTSHPTGFFYSAPASPIHYMISSSSSKKTGSVTSPDQPSGPFEFEFTRKQAQTLTTASMTSADELFFNGQIRPMKLSSHLQRPQAVNGVSNRRLGRSARSAHEVHYTLNRAQSEEMRRKTYLPYKQGLLGCLGFSSKSYGAMNGFARALNPVSSR